MVPELLSGADNGILYEFQGAEWPQKHPPCTDGLFSPGSRLHSALGLKCILSRLSSLEKGRDKPEASQSQTLVFRDLIDTNPACVSLVFPEADVRVEVKPRRGLRL